MKNKHVSRESTKLGESKSINRKNRNWNAECGSTEIRIETVITQTQEQESDAERNWRTDMDKLRETKKLIRLMQSTTLRG